MKKLPLTTISICAGILFLLLGFQLLCVEAYVLTPQTTNVLANRFGPSRETVQGAIQQFAIDTTSPRKVITPPCWLSWATLSAGAVLLAHGVLARWRR